MHLHVLETFTYFIFINKLHFCIIYEHFKIISLFLFHRYSSFLLFHSYSISSRSRKPDNTGLFKIFLITKG